MFFVTDCELDVTRLHVLYSFCGLLTAVNLLLHFMSFLCLSQVQTSRWRHYVCCLSVYPSVCSSITKRERNILKTNWPVLMQVGESGPLAWAWNGQLWRSQGQRSRSHEVEDRFDSLAEAEASFMTPFGSDSFFSLRLQRNTWRIRVITFSDKYKVCF